MLKEGYYKCTSSNYTVITNMFGRIPVQEPYVLRKDELYRVNSVGKLEIPGKGTANITDSIIGILIPYESDAEIKHWNEIRTQASIQIMASIINMQKLGRAINFEKVAYLSVKAADALIGELKKQ
jgi:hypothetical protein